MKQLAIKPQQNCHQLIFNPLYNTVSFSTETITYRINLGCVSFFVPCIDSYCYRYNRLPAIFLAHLKSFAFFNQFFSPDAEV